MKSGSGDDPFAETDSDPGPESDEQQDEVMDVETEPADVETATQPDIPYKFRRDSVKQDRKQRPIFIRPEVEERESTFLRNLEDAVGEDVYKTDALEAALVVAMDNPDLVAEKLREWGYDWEQSAASR
ncbi:hypothetical protein HISP_18265 (plasmid) [Haloarcula hispanica N601]|uniref:Uncharacterized protein n=3 Tax=Haloarcula hispanica TaxID=51589 RepID=A0A482SY41_HALHI|nr:MULTISPECIES: hypothetical protein [Haloarcula]AEM59154.1 conserved hypothetical protein [Haloarcula hispanica ATCC 33960]AHB68026.1 hypothetical protein HISP_18265 [Haloarcula hispanica N601]AJF27651.1 hypothetical protein SG26_17965 [Haloarcula sp. CBA1115]KAA9404377.1 hypothetical protein Har1131_16440 [Haloarcula sp. CBA1131]KAA9404757.1 hypothetical protein EGO51_15475 [Haloarcula hispanica]